MLVFVLVAVPLTYKVPVPPDRVTATCVHWPVASAVFWLIRCSPPARPGVMCRARPGVMCGAWPGVMCGA
jgi:hypothetical protein